MTPDDFFERLAAPTPTPGGGAAAARAGILGCSLLRMVTGITLEKARACPPSEAPTSSLGEVARIRDATSDLARRWASLEEDDVAGFEAYLAALRLPRGAPEERALRKAARERASLRATEAPLNMLEACVELLRLAERLLTLASDVSLRAESDLFGAVELTAAAFEAAELNVRVNWPSLAAPERERLRSSWEQLAREADGVLLRLRAALPSHLGPHPLEAPSPE